jgi:hypothetical protein
MFTLPWIFSTPKIPVIPSEVAKIARIAQCTRRQATRKQLIKIKNTGRHSVSNWCNSPSCMRRQETVSTMELDVPQQVGTAENWQRHYQDWYGSSAKSVTIYWSLLSFLAERWILREFCLNQGGQSNGRPTYCVLAVVSRNCLLLRELRQCQLHEARIQLQPSFRLHEGVNWSTARSKARSPPDANSCTASHEITHPLQTPEGPLAYSQEAATDP